MRKYSRDKIGRFAGSDSSSASADWAARRERLYGEPRKITVKSGNANDIAQTMGDISAKEIADLVGAPNGSIVEVYPMPGGAINVTVKGKQKGDSFIMERTFSREKGELVVKHDRFAVSNDSGPGQKGDGAIIFERSVRNYREAGVVKIKTEAGGPPENPQLNGFYTWARMGYNGKLSASVKKKAAKDLGEVSSVQDIMSKPGGANWWKTNGKQFDGEFDLKAGSKSNQLMDAYAAQRKK